MTIKYTIQKHKQLTEMNNEDTYVVWRNTQGEHGYGCKGVFQGSKKQCQEYLESLKGE